MAVEALPFTFRLAPRLAARLRQPEALVSQSEIVALPAAAILQRPTDSEVEAVRREYADRSLWTSYNSSGFYIVMDAGAVRDILKTDRNKLGWLGNSDYKEINVKRIFDWLKCPVDIKASVYNEMELDAPVIWHKLTGRFERERQLVLLETAPNMFCTP